MRLASDAIQFIIPALILLILLIVLNLFTSIAYIEYPLIASFLVLVFILFFFRDPDRTIPSDKLAILAPSDGKIIAVDNSIPVYLSSYRYRLSIFLSMLNVHINRIPVSGNVQRVEYHKGRFFPAFREKASQMNEHTIIELENDRGKIGFCQRAGAVARRIVCSLSTGDNVKGGDRFGLIRFGSRVDIYLPQNVSVISKVGERVIAGETVLARFREDEP